MWTGQPLKQLPETVVEKTKRDIGGSSMFDGPSSAQRHFDASSASSTARSRLRVVGCREASSYWLAIRVTSS